MNVLQSTTSVVARKTARVVSVAAEISAKSSYGCTWTRSFSDKPPSDDKSRPPARGRGQGAANTFIQKVKQRVFEDRVQLSRVSSIMSPGGSAPKRRVATQDFAVEGQFDSADENSNQSRPRARRPPRHAKNPSTMQRGGPSSEFAHDDRRQSRSGGGGFNGPRGFEFEADEERVVTRGGGAAESMLSQLLDDMDIKVQSGEYELDVDSFTTDGDKFIASLFNETTRAKDGNVLTYYEDKAGIARDLKRIKPARTAMQLLYALQPNIRTAMPGTIAYDTAATAHQLLMRSPYYSDTERQVMVNSVGQILNTKIPDSIKALANDITMQPGFRPGMRAASQFAQQQKPAAPEWYGDQEGGRQIPADTETFLDEDEFDEDDLERLRSDEEDK